MLSVFLAEHKEMGVPLEQKALSLEEKLVSVFFGEDVGDSSEPEEYLESDGNGDSSDPLERNLYWESQEALLQEILEHYNSTSSNVRQEIFRIIEIAGKEDFCKCSKPSFDGCIHCFRRGVVNLLCDKGFRATLCTSKWTHTKKYPGGSHEYIEVIVSTPSRKKQMPFLIELEFRDQFKIAKACDKYHKLVSQLPEYYIGKPDYLNAIVRVVCDAAKRSMKEKKMHMGPWRKTSFMQMKWSGSIERSILDESLHHQVPSLLLRQASESSCLRFAAAPAVVVT
ncbi:uncharacterized protein LOC132181524 [Corylus avellana]|uniref:uncharacterized protein LOC132181524 n=1 Tax=Corylus avellana TaxID=13451 RepID=UPI001E1F1B54|nr:uncharacterized protein LOC132181524 [Corylus avellana]